MDDRNNKPSNQGKHDDASEKSRPDDNLWTHQAQQPLHPWQKNPQHNDQQNQSSVNNASQEKTELKWYQYLMFFGEMDKLAMWCGIIALTAYLLTGVWGAVASIVLGIIELMHNPNERNKYFTIIAMGVAAASLMVLLIV